SLLVRFYLQTVFAHRHNSKWLILLQDRSRQFVEPELRKANQHLTTHISSLEPTSDGTLYLPEAHSKLLDQQWDGIVVEAKIASDLLRKFMSLRLKGIEVLTLDRFFEMFFDKIPVHFI